MSTFFGGGWSVRCILFRAALLLGLTLAGCGGEPQPSESLAEALDDSALEHGRKHADPKYVCPMHPQIVREQPGSCPICGMDLVAKQIDTTGDRQPIVSVRGEILQSMGARTAQVERDTIWRLVQALGRIDYDERLLAHLHPRAVGWMESVAVHAEGESVRSGQTLGEFYSPEILNAQVDFLIARQSQGAVASGSLEKARNRLRLLGVPDDTIAAIERRAEPLNTVPLRAPASGVLTKLGVRQGMYITPAEEIITIADLSRIWVMVDVFEEQISWLRPGLAAEMRVPAFPGRVWEGEVEYIYPELDPDTRTLRVRLAFDNPDLLLKANMFAEVLVYGGPKRDVLVVPREALIMTGKREVVIKALGGGRFQGVEVISGIRRGDKVEILDGLDEGDEILVSGQFLIDSESSLQASLQRLDGGDRGDTPHQSHAHH
jgi:Cu(I)/Ag(I) efflux system membrane fusion protein